MGTILDQQQPQHTQEVPVVILNTGARVSALGFGSELQKSAEEIRDAVIAAVQLGYRHFDTAASFGTETAVGQGIAEALSSGLVKREEIFVTTKIQVMDAAEVLPAVKKSLSVLQLDYVDLCLLHSCVKLRKRFSYPPKEEIALPSLQSNAAWHALEQCMHDGFTKAIGVSNFSVKELRDLLLHAKIVPAVDQVELHPFWQEKPLVEFCRSVGIRISAFHPLASGHLNVDTNPILKAIAVKKEKTPSQVSLRWVIENGIIPIVTSYSQEKLSEYMKIFDFKLSEDDVDLIETIEQRRLGMWDAVPC